MFFRTDGPFVFLPLSPRIPHSGVGPCLSDPGPSPLLPQGGFISQQPVYAQQLYFAQPAVATQPTQQANAEANVAQVMAAV